MEMKEMAKAQDEVTKRKKSNFYSCKMDISLPGKEIISTRRIVGKLIRHVDPDWRYIRIREDGNSSLPISDFNDSNCSSSDNKGVGTEMTSTQSLSIILFLHEEREYGSVHNNNNRYETELTTSAAWQFHHDVKQFSKTDSTAIVSQRYYELDSRLPLWAFAKVHYGNEFLRFNIFVKDFERMKSFYEILIGKSCDVLRQGFCYFVLNKHPRLEIHLSLKCLTNMSPRCTTSAALRFKYRKLDDIKANLLSPPVYITSRLWQTEDPDGNVLLLQEIVQYHLLFPCYNQFTIHMK